MTASLHISSFVPAPQAITEPITKFGGQPVWMQAAEWPLSRDTGRPLRFLGQIDLQTAPLPLRRPHMAYLFLQPYDYTDDKFYEQNFAVVVQSHSADPTDIPTGLTVDGEWTVETRLVDEPAWPELERQQRAAWGMKTFDAAEELFTRYGGPKIGGSPLTLEDLDAEGGEDRWSLLLQLPELDAEDDGPANTPFILDYGDGGCGYFLLSHDAREVRCIWTSN